MPLKPLPEPRLVIFDLDGTLVDSLRDIAEAFNESLRLLALPPRPIQDYRYLVGEGVPKLCRRAIGDTHPHLVGRLIELSRPRYRMRALRHTRPYAGVPQLVDALFQRGTLLATLSNKPDALTRRIVHEFWPDRFCRIQGYVEEQYRKPHPHYAADICRSAGIAPADAWIVGDTPTDIQTARAAGCRAIGAAWGFRPRTDLEAAGADLVVDTPDALRALLTEQ